MADDERLAQRILDEGVPAFVEYWESIPLFASQRSLPRETQAAIRAGRLECDPMGLANSLRGMGTGVQEPLHGLLDTLDMPVLALAGEQDTRYTGIARELAAAGHAAQMENPEWCAEQAIAFVLNREGDHE